MTEQEYDTIDKTAISLDWIVRLLTIGFTILAWFFAHNVVHKDIIFYIYLILMAIVAIL